MARRLMTGSEQLVATLAARGVDTVFGIVGSGFIDPLDLFGAAKVDGRRPIRFIDVKHEQSAVHMADGYARAKRGAIAAVMGQNGPGISNMVTGVATASYNHAPVLVVSPQAGSTTFGWRGFQEMDQMPLFAGMTRYAVDVPHASRIAECTGRAIDRALAQRGPAQVNYARDMVYAEHEVEIPAPVPRALEVPCLEAVREIGQRLVDAERPMILVGNGCRDPGPVQQLAARLNCPVATTYLHNDAYPATCPRAVGPLGYMGSQAAMRSLQDADLVLAVGTRINPFGITPQYGIDYWDPHKPLIQIDRDPNALGVTCSPVLAVAADAVETVRAIDDELVTLFNDDPGIDYTRHNAAWEAELERASWEPTGADGRLRPKAVLRSLRRGLDTHAFGAQHADPIVTTDIGHCCSQALSYLAFRRPESLLTAGTFGACGTAIPLALGARFAEPDRPIVALVGDGAAMMQGINELLTAREHRLGVTVVVFRNEVWGAELLNQLIWTDARAVGSELHDQPSAAGIARAMGVEGVEVHTLDAFEQELAGSIEAQAAGVTTLIEVHCSAEMGAPFRPDAMKPPQRRLAEFEHLTVTEARFGRQYERPDADDDADDPQPQ